MKLTRRSDRGQELQVSRAATCFISMVIVALEPMKGQAHTDRGGRTKARNRLAIRGDDELGTEEGW
jgi:hypothetical protein